VTESLDCHLSDFIVSPTDDFSHVKMIYSTSKVNASWAFHTVGWGIAVSCLAHLVEFHRLHTNSCHSLSTLTSEAGGHSKFLPLQRQPLYGKWMV